jgi:hypothetical protein
MLSNVGHMLGNPTKPHQRLSKVQPKVIKGYRVFEPLDASYDIEGIQTLSNPHKSLDRIRWPPAALDGVLKALDRVLLPSITFDCLRLPSIFWPSGTFFEIFKISVNAPRFSPIVQVTNRLPRTPLDY